MLRHHELIYLPHFQLWLPCLRAKHYYVPVESANALQAHIEVINNGFPAAGERLETCDSAFETSGPDCK